MTHITYLQDNTHIHTHARTHTCRMTHTHICAHTHLQDDTHMHAHTCRTTHTYSHTYTHTPAGCSCPRFQSCTCAPRCPSLRLLQECAVLPSRPTLKLQRQCSEVAAISLCKETNSNNSARTQTTTASTLCKETSNCKHTQQGNKQQLQAHSARKQATSASTLCKETNNNCKHTLQGNKQALECVVLPSRPAHKIKRPEIRSSCNRAVRKKTTKHAFAGLQLMMLDKMSRICSATKFRVERCCNVCNVLSKKFHDGALLRCVTMCVRCV